MANFKHHNNRKPQEKEEGLKVTVRGDSAADFQKALRKFKKKVSNDGILQDLKEREYYEKPSAKRRKAKKAAINRHRRDLAKRNNIS